METGGGSVDLDEGRSLRRAPAVLYAMPGVPRKRRASEAGASDGGVMKKKLTVRDKFDARARERCRGFGVGHSWFNQNRRTEHEESRCSVPNGDSSCVQTTCSAKEPEEKCRASERKLSGLSTEWEKFASDDSDEEHNEEFGNPNDADKASKMEGYRLMDMAMLKNAIAKYCVCSKCKRGPVQLLEREARRQGLASLLVFFCETCQSEEDVWTSDKRSPTAPFEVNERTSVGARLTGNGHAALSTLAAVRDMPPPVNSTYMAKHIATALKAAEEEVEQSLSAAATEITAEVGKEIDVSFDGAWSHRGFTAQYGFTSCISVRTGKVLDYYVASKRCTQCVNGTRRIPRTRLMRGRSGKRAMTTTARSTT